MTTEEAIDVLKMVETHGSLTTSAKEIALKALEKQIAKTPFLEGDGEWNGQIVYDTWECPNCGKEYEVDGEDYDYCPSCGQRIDWSEVDNNEK